MRSWWRAARAWCGLCRRWPGRCVSARSARCQLVHAHGAGQQSWSMLYTYGLQYVPRSEMIRTIFDYRKQMAIHL